MLYSFEKKFYVSQKWYHTHFILALSRQKEADLCDFEASVDYIDSGQPEIHRKTLSPPKKNVCIHLCGQVHVHTPVYVLGRRRASDGLALSLSALFLLDSISP